MGKQVATGPDAALADLRRALQELRDSMLQLESEHSAALHGIASRHSAGARNLLHYLAMRRRDLRQIQTMLATLGLSSLGRAESAALFSVDAVLAVLDKLCAAPALPRARWPCDLQTGEELLDAHTTDVFGGQPGGRSARIMVTMPSEAAGDYTVIRNLLDGGMDCMRINCAHDEPEAWSRMIRHLHQARISSSRHCVILMDLAGPKLRTGAVEPGPTVRKVRPSRDPFGNVTEPGIVWLTDMQVKAPAPSAKAAAILQVDPQWLSATRPGEEISLADTRGRRRVLRIIDRDRGGLWAELRKTAYLTNGIELERLAPGPGQASTAKAFGIHPSEGSISLLPGDLLVLTRDAAPGRSASFDSAHEMLSPARVSCTLPQVFASVDAGDRICLDDGKIEGVVESASTEELRIRVRRTPPRGARLRADKGINLPDSALELPALSERDKSTLEFVASHADLVGLSFVNRSSDVTELINRLHAKPAPWAGIVLKIETQRGFARLPSLLLAAMQHDRVAVMIARGDLAVECGYQRLAEVQEEILWICEAAHCPAIWATQVLESLAKQGIPSRAEITDAAMGHRAECVMLNKGPHVQQALTVLDDILKRMEPHQSKKRAMLRALRIATEYKDT